jgi:hypothetical protein
MKCLVAYLSDVANTPPPRKEVGFQSYTSAPECLTCPTIGHGQVPSLEASNIPAIRELRFILLPLIYLYRFRHHRGQHQDAATSCMTQSISPPRYMTISIVAAPAIILASLV